MGVTQSDEWIDSTFAAKTSDLWEDHSSVLCLKIDDILLRNREIITKLEKNNKYF